MLNFDLSETEEQIRDTIREFVAEELAPRAQELDDSGVFPVDIFKKLGELGFLGLPISEEYGGFDASTLAYIICVEEIAKVCASTALGFAAHVSLGTYPIYAFGTKEQKEKYLPMLCSGTREDGSLALACFGLTESGAGSDAGNTSTRAEKNADGYLVNGRKCWITNASHAATCILTAKTDPTQPRGKGIGAFIAETSTKGFVVEKEEDKLGMRASNTCQIAFEDMQLGPDAMVGGSGGDGDGFRKFMQTLDGGHHRRSGANKRVDHGVAVEGEHGRGV